jgi:hypothetical protein
MSDPFGSAGFNPFVAMTIATSIGVIRATAGLLIAGVIGAGTSVRISFLMKNYISTMFTTRTPRPRRYTSDRSASSRPPLGTFAGMRALQLASSRPELHVYA